MGVCCSEMQTPRNIDNVHEFDKIIILSHALMKDKINEEQIKDFFFEFIITQLTEEKANEIKKHHFLKWIDMSI